MYNFCLPYIKDFLFNDEIKEFTIKYNPKADNLMDLVKFVETYGDRRINIEFQTIGDEVEVISLLEKINSQIYLIPYPHLYGKEALGLFKEKGIKFFLNQAPANWDEFQDMINIGVSDIYITNELGFSLKTIRQIADKHNFKIRTIVNHIGNNGWFNTLDPIRSFFIRPEDMSLYDTLVDTFEFMSIQDDRKRYETLYKIYNKDKKWFGNLAEIIVGLEAKIDSRTLHSTFARYRLDCGKKCYKNSQCQLCNRFVNLSNALVEKNLIIKEKKDGS